MNSVFKNLLMMFCLTFSVLLISCGDDEEGGDGGGPAYCNDLEEFSESWANDLLDAVNEFSNNPTSGTCNAYADAYEQYIDELESILDCPGISAADKAAFEDAKQSAEIFIAEFRTETCGSL